MSVVRQDPAAIGCIAAEIILAELTWQRTPQQMVVPVELITRGCRALLEAEDQLVSPLAVDGTPIDGVDYGQLWRARLGSKSLI